MHACRRAAPAARAPRAARAAPPPRRPRLRVAAGVTDQSARVRGDAARVCFAVADVARWPEWNPITKSAFKRGDPAAPIQKGTRFELRQELFGGVYAYDMLYQVLELEPGKRLVLSGLSDVHTQVDDFVFMPDVHDPDMTVVRYVSDIRLREWRSALQPVVSKLMARVPGEALAALQKHLNGPQSPLFSSEFNDAYVAYARANGVREPTTGRGAARGGGGGGGARGRGGWSFDGLFGGSRGGSVDEGDRKQQQQRRPPPPPNPDPAGHYAALGLALPPAAPPPGDEDVRAAYRRLVMQLHPDRQAGKAPRERREAEEEFKRVLRAYEVLRDPETRRMYDQGTLVEQGAEL